MGMRFGTHSKFPFQAGHDTWHTLQAPLPDWTWKIKHITSSPDKLDMTHCTFSCQDGHNKWNTLLVLLRARHSKWNTLQVLLPGWTRHMIHIESSPARLDITNETHCKFPCKTGHQKATHLRLPLPGWTWQMKHMASSLVSMNMKNYTHCKFPCQAGHWGPWALCAGHHSLGQGDSVLGGITTGSGKHYYLGDCKGHRLSANLRQGEKNMLLVLVSSILLWQGTNMGLAISITPLRYSKS